MTDILVCKNTEGKLTGFGEKDKRAYLRFILKLKELEPGELMTLSYSVARDLVAHRKHFAIITKLFDSQEQFDDMDVLRKWLYVGAGHCDFVPGPSGRMVAIAKSIDWSKLPDDNAFLKVHDAVVAFMRSLYCTNFLWPHLTPFAASEMIELCLTPPPKEEEAA